jgi:hypothetical protein
MIRIARWPARALGWYRSPLLRRADRIEAAIMAGLVAVFLIAGPLLAIVAARMTDAGDIRQQQAERSWREVPATVLGVAGRPDSWGGPGLRARWAGPDGRQRTGVVPAATPVNAGRQLRIWVNPAGQVTYQPIARWEIDRDLALAAVTVPLALGFVLYLGGGCVRLVARRRRLAGWEQEWRAVGPQWSRLP